MEKVFQVDRSGWHHFLASLGTDMHIYVPVQNDDNIDYELFIGENQDIVYNHPIPSTPLKNFFLPFRENVVNSKKFHNKKIIIGIPSCDLKGLHLLDEIYLDGRFTDPAYKKNREDSILIGTDCHTTIEHCHCTSYGTNPFPENTADVGLNEMNGHILLTGLSDKGNDLINSLSHFTHVETVGDEVIQQIESMRNQTVSSLAGNNRDLPSYEDTGALIRESEDEIWKEHAGRCVSCGACAVICPTCSCFLLIDRPDFEKIRQVDACQYPGFERIAAGEDPLGPKHIRLRNRYFCKYIWKPEVYKSPACTGCGRCIACCPGNINKNEIITTLAASS